MNRQSVIITVLVILMAASLMADVAVGSVTIPLGEIWRTLFSSGADDINARILLDVRIPKAVCALLVGVALGVSGLQMQTLFRNPLAGPYVLGISSGAGLGVALFLLGAPLLGTSFYTTFLSFGIAGAAWIGAAAILVTIMAVGSKVKDIMVLLILGMMFSSGVSAIVQILQYLSRDEALKAFVIWTMGSLGDVTGISLWLLTGAVAAGLLLALFAVKSLNLMLLGEEYARSAGMKIGCTRFMVLASTTLLAGTVTAFCGPIGFIGLAVPHIARAIIRSADNRILLPVTSLCGASIMLLCDLVSKLWVLPINSITALLGIPVVVWVVLRNKNFSI